MTAIGINAMAFEGRAGSFVSVTASQIKVTDGQDFGSVFAQKLQSDRSEPDRERTVTTIKPETTEYSKEQATTQRTATGKTDDFQQVTGTEKNDGSINDTAAINSEAQVLKQDEEDIEQAIEVLNTLMQGIADILQMTVNELEGAFEQAGVMPQDMFDTDSLAGFILNLNGCDDMSDMLMDNNMLEAFNDIKELTAQILENFNVTAEDIDNATGSNLFKELMDTEGFVNAEGLLDRKALDKLISDKKAVNVEMPEADETDILTGNTENKEFTVEFNKTDDSAERKENGASNDRAQTKEIKGTESPAQSFVRGIENAVREMDIDMPVNETGVTVRDIVFQLVDAVKVNITPDNTKLEMSLNPESLGRVNLNITSKNGVMTAQITTENEVSKEALESQLQILKENIEAQGVKVEAIEVTVSSYIFSDSKNADSEEQESSGRSGKASKGNAIGDGDAIVSESEAERLQHEVMLQNGGTVDYVA